jgi:hypothetical protein
MTFRAGNTSAFAAKVNVSGSALIISTYHGAANAIASTSIAIAPSGTIVVAGQASSIGLFPTTSGAYETRSVYDAGFVAGLNPLGTALIFSTLLGGSNDSMARIISM